MTSIYKKLQKDFLKKFLLVKFKCNFHEFKHSQLLYGIETFYNWIDLN